MPTYTGLKKSNLFFTNSEMFYI